jgi:hypothetical protein
MPLGTDPNDIFHDGYWYNRNGRGGPATLEVDANGNTVGIVGADGQVINMTDERYRQFSDGQPFKVTRPIAQQGVLIGDFTNPALWTISSGTPTLSSVTGYDGAGNKNGSVQSRTGMPSMLKVAVQSADDIIILPPANMTPVRCEGKLGLWCYLDVQPGYQPAGTPSGAIGLYVGTSSGSYATTSEFFFNSNQLREGWNFLKAVKETVPTANGPYSGSNLLADAGGRDAHFLGITETAFNVGIWGDIINNPITCVKLEIAGLAGANVYFDSLWGNFTSKAQVVIGCDATGSSLINLALPIFKKNSWIGYVATPRRVSNPTYSVATDWRNSPSDGVSITSNGIPCYLAGWDFINHTMNHNRMGDYTSDVQIASEIQLVDGWYKAQGLTRGTEFYASPQSSSSRLSEQVIKNCGIKLQRHARKQNTSITPWGLDNPHHIGAIDMGQRSLWQKASLIKAHVNMLIRYGDSGHLFWHVLTQIGDDGSGETLGSDDLTLPYSNFSIAMDHIRAKEQAGLLNVCKGMSGFYYGY